MIDIKKLRDNPKPYRESARLRGLKVDIDRLVAVAAKRNEMIGDVETLRSQLKLTGKPDAVKLKELQDVKARLAGLEDDFKAVDAEYQDLVAQVPNVLADGTPEGGEEANRQESTWGEARRTTTVKDHVELAESNGWLDFERGAKVAGSKFYYLKGALVRLELALVQMALDYFEGEGFTPMMVPHMVSTRVADGAGFLPRGEERQIYKIEGEDLNLIATAEMPLTGYHADEIIDPEQLPLLYAGYSPSYRMEAGAYGKYSRGLYRVHQFNKLELYVFCRQQDSEHWHEKLVAYEEKLCQMLELPYRRVRIAAGDLGAPAYKKFDIEYWSPIEGEYRELMSCSNVTDYQARRLNIRTRGEDGKTEFVHTLNGTAAAMSRTPIALIENHQKPDGTVEVPKALQKYYGRGVL